MVLAAMTSGIAQHQHPTTTPEKPVALLAGLGTWRHPIATRNAEAQKFFDQGLTLIYGFNRPEALRSFHKASELDPRAAMAYWGIAMALGPYINMDMDPDVHLKEACDAVDAGLGVPGVSETDSAWLHAAGARCPDYADPGGTWVLSRSRAALRRRSGCADTLCGSIAASRSMALVQPRRKPAEGVAEAERVLEGVLHRHPDHPGANHFYIHAVESSPTPERAVPSAQRLMGIVPAPATSCTCQSYLAVLGDYNNTVAVNERAVEVDRQYFAQTGMMGSYFAYYCTTSNSFCMRARCRAAGPIRARPRGRFPSRWRRWPRPCLRWPKCLAFS